MAEDRSAYLAERLSAGVAALRAGRPERAVPALLEVADDPELAAAPDLRDVRARAISLSAQALLLVGRSEDALPRAERALAMARELGDIEGVHEIEQLLSTIRSTPKPAPREPKGPFMVADDRIQNPALRAERLLREANAALDQGRPTDAAATARRALEMVPDSARIGVLARLCLARCEPDRAAATLDEAAERARDASEPTLLGLVARTAELLGVELEVQRGPDPVRGAVRGGG